MSGTWNLKHCARVRAQSIFLKGASFEAGFQMNFEIVLEL